MVAGDIDHLGGNSDFLAWVVTPYVRRGYVILATIEVDGGVHVWEGYPEEMVKAETIHSGWSDLAWIIEEPE